jgi:F-type H+-transporting ATPase subunit a
MDFNNKVYYVKEFLGAKIWITETIVNTWLIMLVLFALIFLFNLQVKKFQRIPKGLQNFVEMLVDGIDGLIKSNIGPEYMYFSGCFLGLFIFLIFSNLSGLISLRPPTADLATTFTLSMVIFFLIHIMGMLKSKEDYFKSYIKPYAILLPLNIISELSTPISLAFRLFGNMFGGFIITEMVYNLFPMALRFVFPAVLHIYFDIFSGILQSVIFVILSMTFIKNKLPQ